MQKIAEKEQKKIKFRTVRSNLKQGVYVKVRQHFIVKLYMLHLGKASITL